MIFGVSAQRPEAVAEFATRTGITFPMLIDADREVTRVYGVHTLFSLDGLGPPTVNLPHNSTFLIDSAGIIRFVHVSLRSDDIPDEAELLAAMGQIT